MPEGDTIHRLAARLAPRLVGRALERVTTQGLARDIAGRTVARVEAHGKHLVIELDDGAHVRTHLGMYGRVRIYDRAAGDEILARTSPGRASLALVTADTVVVWLGARTVEVSPRRAPLHGHAVAALGPDVLAPDFDPAAAAARAARDPRRPIADALLDQRVAAGIGNVYKSEALHLVGLAPLAPVGEIPPDTLARLYAIAHALMRANLGPGPRTTTSTGPTARRDLAGARPDEERYHVYSRSGRPCRACGAAIRCAQLGDPPRWTWWCPVCQPDGRPPSGPGG